jgi:uncharacterized membrane protein
MFQFMLVVGLVLAYYGYAVTKNPRIWGDQGRDAIKEENWNRYVRYNGQFAMYAGFLMAALGALDMAVNLSTAIYLLILLGGLAILVSLRPLDARKRGHLEPLAPRGNRKAEAQAPDQRAGAPGKEKQKEIRRLWVT